MTDINVGALGMTLQYSSAASLTPDKNAPWEVEFPFATGLVRYYDKNWNPITKERFDELLMWPKMKDRARRRRAGYTRTGNRR